MKPFQCSILSLVSTHAGVDGACAGHAEVAAVAHVLDVDSVVRGRVVLGEYRCKYTVSCQEVQF